MTDYLPKDATIEQACNWLQAKTGETWILPRLLECHLTPYFWLDYKQGYPTVYGNRIEGYQSRMMFQGDLCRLESDGGYALVNMFAAHDGALIKVEPGVRVALSDLRFKRDRVERVAEIINKQKTAPAQSPATPAPVVPDEVDLTMVATRTELIDAFGKFTDMDKSWFDNLTDAPKLKAARKYTGQGGRHSAEPLFCPYLVMQWMADPKRKKGRRLNDTTAWRLLKSHFPKVYNQYSIGDPNTD